MKSTWMMAGLLSAALLIAACGGATTEQPVVQGEQPAAAREAVDVTLEVAGAPDSIVKIIGTIGSTNYLVDSTACKAGMVHLKRDTALPSGLYFVLMPHNVVLQFLLDQDQTFSIKTDQGNPVGNAKVDGSVDNTLLYENLAWEQAFQARFAPLDMSFRAAAATDPNKTVVEQQLNELVKERKAHLQGFKDKHPTSFFTIYKLAGQNPDLRDIRLPDGSFDEQKRVFHYRDEFWNNTPLDDARLLRTPIIFNKLNTYITQITPQVHDSVVKYADRIIDQSKVNKEIFKFVVNWIAIEYHTPKNMGMESVFVHVVDKYFTDQDAFWSTPTELIEIRREVNEMRPSLVGQIGKDLTCTTPQGQEESLYALKGKATILFIYNYECEHCQEQTPDMKKLYDSYHGRGLEIFALCTGTDEKEWRAFIQKYKISGFHNVWDPQYKSDFYKKYHVDITPECYVLDANHKIVSKDLQPKQLPEVLEPLLK
jgi:peroxiredoxin